MHLSRERRTREYCAPMSGEEQEISLVERMFPERQFRDATVDASRHDLVEEFRRRPLGPYGAELQELLFVLRTQDRDGRYVLLVRSPRERWAIGRARGRGAPLEQVLDAEFDSLEAAEWAVFALRWRDHTGEELDVSWDAR